MPFLDGIGHVGLDHASTYSFSQASVPSFNVSRVSLSRTKCWSVSSMPALKCARNFSRPTPGHHPGHNHART